MNKENINKKIKILYFFYAFFGTIIGFSLISTFMISYYFCIPMAISFFIVIIIRDKIDICKEVINQKNENFNENSKYTSKAIMTDWEKQFYKLLNRNFANKYNIMAQVPLSSIIRKEKEFTNQYQSELYRTIDFGLFDDNFIPILLIELNDKTHNTTPRKERDVKVKDICNQANIPIIFIRSDSELTERDTINLIKEKIKNEYTNY